MGIHTQHAIVLCLTLTWGPFVSTCWFIRGARGWVPLEALQLFDDMKSKQLEVAPPKNRGGREGEVKRSLEVPLLFKLEEKTQLIFFGWIN